MQHGALDQANQGMIDGLKDNGFEEGKNLKIDQQNAQGDQSNLQTIAQQFISNEIQSQFLLHRLHQLPAA